MEKYIITPGAIQNMVLESAKRVLKEDIDDYLGTLTDSVAVALADKYGFGTEFSYDAAEKAVSQLDDVDALTGDEAEDFDKCLQRAMANYINESLTKKKVLKEGEEEEQECKAVIRTCRAMIDDMFKKDDIDNVSPEALKDLIIRVYEELSSVGMNL